MSPISQRLSVEELAVVLYQTGMTEQAEDLISSHFGSVPKEEMATRLVTASNSLMARELLMPDILINKLDASLEKIGKIIGEADFNVHCSRNAVWNIIEMSYHFYQDIILENKVLMKVVHELTEMPDIASIIKNQVDLIHINEAEPFNCPSAIIPNLALSEFLDIKDNIPITDRLCDPELGGVIPDETRNLFGEDWSNSQYWGLYLRYEKGSPPAFEQGFMVLRGEKRFWMMRPVLHDGELMMETQPVVQKSFEQELKTLLEKD